jgi:hypothetical protein
MEQLWNMNISGRSRIHRSVAAPSAYPAFHEACSGCRGRCEVLYFLHPTFHTVKMDCLQYCANFPAKSEKYANLAFNILCWVLWWRGDNQKIEGWNITIARQTMLQTGRRYTVIVTDRPQIDSHCYRQATERPSLLHCYRKATENSHYYRQANSQCYTQATHRQSLLKTG